MIKISTELNCQVYNGINQTEDQNLDAESYYFNTNTEPISRKDFPKSNTEIIPNIKQFLDIWKIIEDKLKLSNKSNLAPNDIVSEFRSSGSKILISTVFEESMVCHSNLRIVIFNQDAFVNVPLCPSVLLNKVRIFRVLDKHENILRKITKIDRCVKQRFIIK